MSETNEVPESTPAPVEELRIAPAPEAAPATAEEVASLRAELEAVRRAEAARTVAESLGGSEVVQTAMDWARNNMSQDQIDSINSDLGKASVEGQKAIMSQLIQQSGAQPSTPYVGGTAQAPGTQPFNSTEEFQNTLADPRYKTDPTFRDEILRRLSVSDI